MPAYPKIRVYHHRRSRTTGMMAWEYLGSSTILPTREVALRTMADISGFPIETLRAEMAEHFGYYIED